jgi:hypothetical protein
MENAIKKNLGLNIATGRISQADKHKVIYYNPAQPQNGGYYQNQERGNDPTMINEDMTQRECSLASRVANLTYQEIRKAIDKIITDLEKGKKPGAKQSPKAKRGKMTLKELQKQGDGLSTVELKDPDLRLLKSTLNKHGVDFSAVKDGKGQYTVFFKGKDADTVTHAFKQYTQKMVKQENRKMPSIAKALAAAKKLAQSLNIGKDKEKTKSKGAR